MTEIGGEIPPIELKTKEILAFSLLKCKNSPYFTQKTFNLIIGVKSPPISGASDAQISTV